MLPSQETVVFDVRTVLQNMNVHTWIVDRETRGNLPLQQQWDRMCGSPLASTRVAVVRTSFKFHARNSCSSNI